MARRPSKPRNLSETLSRFDGDDAWGQDNGTTGSWLKSERCYATHPPLVMPNGLTIYGGSCFTPVVKDAAIYIGFDAGMKTSARSYPWTTGHEIHFPIHDMDAPSDRTEFRNLVEWTRERLAEGAKVHCGCIGGHGRTGTFLAALAATYGVEDPIGFVRSNYCKKAVESRSQVRFLCEEYGAKSTEGAKQGLSISARASAGYKSAKEISADKGFAWMGDSFKDPAPRREPAGVTRKGPDGATVILYDPGSDKLIF